VFRAVSLAPVVIYSTPMTELLDVLLPPAGLPTGVVKARDAVHRGGDLHRTLHLWLVRGQNVLMQRRSLSKDLEPGKLDVAVGGHFGVGETLAEVLREADEELGIAVAVGELSYLGTFRATRYYPGVVDDELQESYLLRRDAPLESYLLNPDEVEVLYELPLEGAIALYEHGTPVAAAGYDCYGRQNNALLIADDLIEQARADVAERLRQIQTLLAETPSQV
jgi:isopentenyldiphosphate isomerase